MALIQDAWNDPNAGLTAADFARWPDGGGLSRVNREKSAALLQGAVDNGDLGLPVYLVGTCATYDTPHGHPSFAGAVDDWNTFVVWGEPGTAWPTITTIKRKGLLSKKIVSSRLPRFDQTAIEEFPQSNGGYVDLQMSLDGSPTARIGFYFSPGTARRAHEQVQAVLNALETCRSGSRPDGQPAAVADGTSGPTVHGPSAHPVPATDWRDVQTIRAEWETDTETPDWGNAMSMFDEGPVVGQRLNVAEYLARRLKLVLLGSPDLSDDLAAEVCRRILVLLSQPVLDWQEEYVPRLVRLPLAIMRDRGWQSPMYGGDGTVAIDLDAPAIRASVATSLAPDGDYLRFFFEDAPSPGSGIPTV